PWPRPRTGASLTALPDGRVLVAGGFDAPGCMEVRESAVDVFDPATERWVALDPLARPRANHDGFLLPDGRVLLHGGTTPVQPRDGQRRAHQWEAPATHEILAVQGGARH